MFTTSLRRTASPPSCVVRAVARSARLRTSGVWEKLSDGGLAWPSPLKPQQATSPSVLMPQLCAAPALTARNLV